MTDVSVIVPSIHANEELLSECLIAVNATAPSAELVLADTPGYSFSQNCNKGAQDASGSFLVFLNDDCVPAPGWLDSLIEAFIEPDVAIAGSCLRYPHTLALQHAGVFFDLDEVGQLRANNVTDELQNSTRDVDAVTGACLAVRADLFHEADGFDTEFVNGYEDVDLCLRVRTAGWRIRYVAESVVLHHESASGPARWTHVHENVARLQALWHTEAREVSE